MKWYDDIREELTLAGLIGIVIVAMLLKQNEIAAVSAGGLISYLKREKKNGIGIQKPGGM